MFGLNDYLKNIYSKNKEPEKKDMNNIFKAFSNFLNYTQPSIQKEHEQKQEPEKHILNYPSKKEIEEDNSESESESESDIDEKKIESPVNGGKDTIKEIKQKAKNEPMECIYCHRIFTTFGIRRHQLRCPKNTNIGIKKEEVKVDKEPDTKKKLKLKGK